jgi:sugar-specific transcriptional regulator TrmB
MATSDLKVAEIRILIHLISNGPSAVDDISRAVKIGKTETYNLVSSLLSRGIVFSMGGSPQKYCVLCREEATDLMTQSQSSFIEMLENEKSRCMNMLADLVKKRAAAGS